FGLSTDAAHRKETQTPEAAMIDDLVWTIELPSFVGRNDGTVQQISSALGRDAQVLDLTFGGEHGDAGRPFGQPVTFTATIQSTGPALAIEEAQTQEATMAGRSDGVLVGVPIDKSDGFGFNIAPSGRTDGVFTVVLPALPEVNDEI